MNKDIQLIFEAYKNRLVNENMPSNVFNNLKKYINKGPINANKPSKEKGSSEFRQQMPDSKEEYSAHDYAKEMEIKGEGEESACIEDIAAKHGVSLDVIKHQLEMGIKVETEHTDDFDVATKIATDHLNEDPHYYTKLAKMESENEERRLDPKCWKGYHKAGTKLKDGVRVNNCVKN